MKNAKTVKPLCENPVEPTNLFQAINATIALLVALQRQRIASQEVVAKYAVNMGALADEVFDYGEQLHFNRMSFPQLWSYFQGAPTKYEPSVLSEPNPLRSSMRSMSRRAIRRRMRLADSLCLHYIGRRPFAKWRASDENLDWACEETYVWVASGHDVDAPRTLPYFFEPGAKELDALDTAVPAVPQTAPPQPAPAKDVTPI